MTMMIDTITTENEVAQETAKRKIEVETKEEVEVHHVTVAALHFSLKIVRDLVIEDVTRRLVIKLSKRG